ncbi:hypothetical protein TCAP_06364 [Tolypocladium capitatum]|uniref:Uncharacterized protein n=1 Tax=Tolypocladium capitatum TaxID=45235 RepID=A0A2K3Q851_9HYPO|nr:hypothetical protein TCAP_06364 [Tolypocladium capitatum]
MPIFAFGLHNSPGSADEVAQLQAHAVTGRVTKLELSPQYGKIARATTDTAAQDDDTELLERRQSAGHYHDFLRDGSRRSQCNETKAFHKDILPGNI